MGLAYRPARLVCSCIEVKTRLQLHTKYEKILKTLNAQVYIEKIRDLTRATLPFVNIIFEKTLKRGFY